MQNVLADLCIESEAATVTAMRLARAYDSAGDEREVHVPAARDGGQQVLDLQARAVHAGEALECLGGDGFVEESGMPRLYREAPLNSIWEGSGNVICLDVLRAMARTPQATEVLMDEIEQGAAAERRLRAYLEGIQAELSDFEGIEARARRIVERLAIALQASLLVRYGDPAVADAFCVSRLESATGAVPSARCRPASTSGRSSSATPRACSRRRAARYFQEGRPRAGATIS